jgi:hypothetical protein
MFLKKFLPLALLFGIILVGLGLFYRAPLLSPNQTFMGGGLDGLKNYYTPWYHAKYDSSYTWFQGMNYPYGDHVVFADAQPLLSNSIKLLGLADWTVGIINYALLLSVFVTGWLLYKILMSWQVNPWWAAISAAAITMLSPQMLKMNGHYALAYTFAVPLIWYLILKFFERPVVGQSMVIATIIFLMGWLHPYFVMVSAVFLTAFWLFQTLIHWRGMVFWKRILHFGLQVVLPMALFTLILKLTDPVQDRPENPYGIEIYVATWRSIFMPIAVKFLQAIPNALWKNIPESWEGLSFVGFGAAILFPIFWVCTLVRLVIAAVRRKLKQFDFVGGENLSVPTKKLIAASVLAGLAVGIFSCGFPFAIKPELLTELFPPIKQFRSLGRFSWVFYYTWVTFTFFLFWQMIQWLRRKKLAAVGIAMGVVVAGWTLFEGGGLNEGVRIRTWVVKLMTYWEGEPGMIPGMKPSPWMPHIQPEKYSAIMVLPYFHEGSENLRTAKIQRKDAFDSNICKQAFEASIRTGIPMLNVMMSRTSLNQAWTHLQLVTEPNSPLEILDKIKDPRPILAMRFAKAPEFDGPYVQPVGTIVYQQDTVVFYEMDLRKLQDSLLSLRNPAPDSLMEHPAGLKTSSVDSSIVWIDFEGEGNGPGYRTPKGKTVQLKDNNLLYNGHIEAKEGDTLIFSLWMKMRSERLPITELGIEEFKGEEVLNWDYLTANNNIKRLDGEWALCEREYVVKSSENTFKFNVTRWRRIPPEITVDNFLVRKKGTDVYRFENGQLVWKNNRYLPKP